VTERRDDEHLPRAVADRITRPFARFLRIESATGLALLAATAVALIVSSSAVSGSVEAFWNTPLGVHFGSADFSRSLRHWVNDCAMTLFFFVVSLELKREMVHGELRSLRMAAFSLAAALGGMVVPACVYLALMHDEPGVHGWGTVMATDTAFVIGALALLGSRVPASLRVFLLSLAIFDDVGAILVVAIGYGSAPSWPALAIAAAVVAAVRGASRVGVRSIPVYYALGAGLWLALDAAGVHPTLAGVVLGLMTPAREWVSDQRLHSILERVLSYPLGRHWSGDTADRADLRRAGVAAKEALSPVERLEIALHPWTGFVIMPLFALANAGVRISLSDLTSRITVAIFAGLVLGKPAGVVALSWLAERTRLARRAEGLEWPVIFGGALLTGIGFTMSLFIATLAFDDPGMLSSAKLGILGASVVAGSAGLVALTWLARRKRTEHGRREPAVTSEAAPQR